MDREYNSEVCCPSNNIWFEMIEYVEQLDSIEDKDVKEKVLARVEEIKKELLSKGYITKEKLDKKLASVRQGQSNKAS